MKSLIGFDLLGNIAGRVDNHDLPDRVDFVVRTVEEEVDGVLVKRAVQWLESEQAHFPKAVRWQEVTDADPDTTHIGWAWDGAKGVEPAAMRDVRLAEEAKGKLLRDIADGKTAATDNEKALAAALLGV
jgi:hypothetical protein